MADAPLDDTVSTYNYEVVRRFTLMTLFWGVLGMGMGAVLAAQLVWPQLNLGLPWTSFGRIRPVHTNLVIFAFGGGALFATSFYVVQRTCKVRLISDWLANFVFWGWQVAIVAMLVSYPLGITSSKEYAEMEWPIALWVTLVWVAYAYLFIGTIARRRTQHIYVANWFYGAFILVTAMVHVINHVAIPVTLFKSYSAYSGATDAMIQWWYGHSVVGFILSVGFLGMMYYFVPSRPNVR
ncbi:MAG TPA: cytochrome C oxidase Cbb3, partial [Pseudomonas sp.]|nr:cytochrome C oxidase Cbb3 [Pseudomonas sp.]